MANRACPRTDNNHVSKKKGKKEGKLRHVTALCGILAFPIFTLFTINPFRFVSPSLQCDRRSIISLLHFENETSRSHAIHQHRDIFLYGCKAPRKTRQNHNKGINHSEILQLIFPKFISISMGRHILAVASNHVPYIVQHSNIQPYARFGCHSNEYSNRYENAIVFFLSFLVAVELTFFIRPF